MPIQNCKKKFIAKFKHHKMSCTIFTLNAKQTQATAVVTCHIIQS